ncbi:hypothetical protein GEMRC1_009473 [Eukaryota sp. GEM-RC1]
MKHNTHTRTDETSSFHSEPTRSSCNPRACEEPLISTLLPNHEEYELPSEAPFTAKIVNVAYNATEADIRQAFSSLPVKEVRSPSNIPGTFFVEFLDVQGLKQCLDKYWMFKIHGRPIRTYVASTPRSSVKPLNTSTFSSKPNAEPKPLELLPFTASFQTPLRYLHFQQSLLILINVHLLRSLCESSLEWDREEPRDGFLCLKNELHSFFKKVGYVSHHFFESAFLATKVYLQTNTFHVEPEDLPQLSSFASFFGAEIQSVFLHEDRSFNAEKFINYSNVISGLELTLENHNDLEFLNKSSLIFPRLKELHVCADFSISMPLIELLKVNTAVTSIDLDYHFIGAEGGITLSDAIKVNNSIHCINLNSNSIGSEGASALAEALKVNTTVTRIDLCANSIGPEGASALAQALKVNTALTRIDLCANSIGPDGASALAEALKVNCIITSINLDENFVEVEGARALAEALKVNSTVTSIVLSRNSIGPEGAIVLADALKVNHAVASVDLTWNFIEDEGVIALAEALKVNTRLTSIDLCLNSIGCEGVRALVDALKVNCTITSINLDENSFKDEEFRILENVLKRK